jgi:hypothetical protein
MSKLTRDKVETRPVLIASEVIRIRLHAWIDNLPIDPNQPIEVLIREQVKKRKLTLNAAMWAGPLADIERDGWVQGRQFRAEIWHEHFKELFLPDENAPDFDRSHVLDGYQKWDVNPWSGNRVLVGSTTQLTDKGMREYLLKMEAEAATEYGVTFTEPEPVR